MTLAERLAEAERAESGPRKQVLTLTTAYEAACAADDHAEAARLAPDLDEARQDLLIAEATATALRAALESVEQQRQAEAEARTRARDAEVARDDRDRALEARTRAQEKSAALRAQIPAALDGVKRLIGEALAADREAAAASAASVAAMVRTGERAPGFNSSVPEPTRNLLDRDETLRGVREWTGAGLPEWMVGPR